MGQSAQLYNIVHYKYQVESEYTFHQDIDNKHQPNQL